VWTGHRAGVEGAVERHGADAAWVIDSLPAVLGRWLSEADRVWFDSSEDHSWSNAELVAKLDAWKADAGNEMLDADQISNELRLIKSDAELAYLQKAIDITTDAQRAAMAAIRPGMYEYEVEALIEFVFRAQGSPRIGFNSIVGSGPNSTILHYEENDRRMEADDMVVMDIGAEWAYYTADVTRTVPVDGEFSPEQAAIYQIVLNAQNAGIEAVRPGITIRDIHLAATRVVVAGLIEQGILSGTVEANLESGAYRRFFMHGTSHWLGLDVHDVGGYVTGAERRPRLLEPGMVFSVEPGIYIAEGAEGVDPRWWNIGVRIEDDVVVTETGGRLMSGGAPREIDEIEAIMAGRGLPEVVPGD
ncbi:MAG TPA: aminopeptidase P family protein, partial [Gemmatimonadota bacterium]|nr:aminopeptidase P family protein [Gemmatimonadota bacterium]